MICPNCESEYCNIMYGESFPCAHCDEDFVIEYYTCKKCNAVFRALNGEADIDTMISPNDITNVFNPLYNTAEVKPEELSEEEREFLNKIEKEITRSDPTTMSDLIHRCVRCDAVVHESKPGAYECDECGFSWEIINFE